MGRRVCERRVTSTASLPHSHCLPQFITFINNVSIPFAYASRAVVYKQADAGLYSEVTKPG